MAQERLQTLRVVDIIGIEDADVPAFGYSHSLVDGVMRTVVSLVNQADLAVIRIGCIQKSSRAIGRAVVDDNQFPIAQSLADDTFNGLANEQCMVVGRYDNRYVNTAILACGTVYREHVVDCGRQ